MVRRLSCAIKTRSFLSSTRGLKVDELQLAWDFTTGSAEWQTRDVLDAHNAAAAVNAIDPPVIEVVGTDSTNDDRMAHLVHGTIRVPSVLDGEGPGSPLLRNEEGRVITSGFATYPFVVVIPKSALERDDAAPVLHFGHGFFGKRSEALGGAVRNIAHESKSVVFAVDWIGMAEDDITSSVRRSRDISSGPWLRPTVSLRRCKLEHTDHRIGLSF